MNKNLIKKGILLAFGALTILSLVACSSNTQIKKTVIKQRQITGKAVDIGSGSFTVGTDIQAGLYDLIPKVGQEGSITVKSKDTSDLSLGCTENTLGIIDANNSDDNGIPKMRLKLNKGDIVNINGVNKTHFEPVKSPLVGSTPKKISLYQGRFVVGEDIAPGKYTIIGVKGSGSVNVYDNKIDSTRQVISDQHENVLHFPKQATITLKNGNPIFIIGIEQVDFIPIE